VHTHTQRQKLGDSDAAEEDAEDDGIRLKTK